MDEPASALDPIATAHIEELIHELSDHYTVVIVTHNMQQAARVSDYTAFFYMGDLVEFDETDELFTKPSNRGRKTTSSQPGSGTAGRRAARRDRRQSRCPVDSCQRRSGVCGPAVQCRSVLRPDLPPKKDAVWSLVLDYAAEVSVAATSDYRYAACQRHMAA